MARLKGSVDSRYQDRIAKSGSIMLCELQGAAEDFMFRWGIIAIFKNSANQNSIFAICSLRMLLVH